MNMKRVRVQTWTKAKQVKPNFVIASLLSKAEEIKNRLSRISNISKFQFDVNVERLKHEPLARETGRQLLTILTLNKLPLPLPSELRKCFEWCVG